MSNPTSGLNHKIPLDTAKKMTAKFRAKKTEIIAEPYRSKNILPQAETFDRSAFDTVLSLPECVALRIYYGLDDNDGLHAIIVGVNANNEDILPDTSDTSSISNVVIIEEGKTCPPYCAPDSPLNR